MKKNNHQISLEEALDSSTLAYSKRHLFAFDTKAAKKMEGDCLGYYYIIHDGEEILKTEDIGKATFKYNLL